MLWKLTAKERGKKQKGAEREKWKHMSSLACRFFLSNKKQKKGISLVFHNFSRCSYSFLFLALSILNYIYLDKKNRQN